MASPSGEVLQPSESFFTPERVIMKPRLNSNTTPTCCRNRVVSERWGAWRKVRDADERSSLKEAGMLECALLSIPEMIIQACCPRDEDRRSNAKLLTHHSIHLDNGLGLQSRSPPHFKVWGGIWAVT